MVISSGETTGDVGAGGQKYKQGQNAVAIHLFKTPNCYLMHPDTWWYLAHSLHSIGLFSFKIQGFALGWPPCAQLWCIATPAVQLQAWPPSSFCFASIIYSTLFNPSLSAIGHLTSYSPTISLFFGITLLGRREGTSSREKDIALCVTSASTGLCSSQQSFYSQGSRTFMATTTTCIQRSL